MYVADSRDPQGPGFLPGQFRDFDQQGFPLENRTCILALRLLGRRDPPEGLGEYQIDKDSVGDATGLALWRRDTGLFGRSIPGWRHAWPVLAAGEDGGDAEGLEGPLFRPTIRKPVPENLDHDKRYAWTVLLQPHHSDGQLLHPRPAGDQLGIALDSTEERRQYALWLRTDPRMVLPLHDPTCAGQLLGDMAADVRKDGAAWVLDRERHARMASLLRIVREPVSAHPNIAFAEGGGIEGTNLLALFAGTGDPAAGGSPSMPPVQRGYLPMYAPWSAWSTIPPGGTGSPPVGVYDAIALCSYSGFGPLSTGALEDKHHLGADADGNPINPAHLAAESLWMWHADAQRDAPMEFAGTDYEPAVLGPYPHQVLLRYDPAASHSLGSGGPLSGLWRWETYIPVGVAGSPGEPTTVSEQHDPTRRGFAFTNLDFAATALLFRPMKPIAGLTDLRNAVHRIPAALVEEFHDTAPMVLRMEAFGNLGNGQEYACTKGLCDRWRGGTCGGGIAFLPPEVDMTDYVRGFAPDRVALSTCFIAAVPGVWWGGGYPDPTTGRVKSGYRWGTTAAGLLRFDRMDTGSVDAETLEMDALGNVGLGGGSYGAGERVVYLRNAIRDPSSDPVDGGILYVSGGALCYRGSSGSVTTIAPA